MIASSFQHPEIRIGSPGKEPFPHNPSLVSPSDRWNSRGRAQNCWPPKLICNSASEWHKKCGPVGLVPKLWLPGVNPKSERVPNLFPLETSRFPVAFALFCAGRRMSYPLWALSGIFQMPTRSHMSFSFTRKCQTEDKRCARLWARVYFNEGRHCHVLHICLCLWTGHGVPPLLGLHYEWNLSIGPLRLVFQGRSVRFYRMGGYITKKGQKDDVESGKNGKTRDPKPCSVLLLRMLGGSRTSPRLLEL